jgi:DtxR family Mn-dependent transcriptional regulator
MVRLTMIENLSHAEQEYLKMAYLLDQEKGHVTTRQLAERLKVKPASVSAMVKHLSEDGDGAYIRHTPYQDIELTEKGRRIALELVRHQRLLELFLYTTLDMPWELVRAEAGRLAPIISEDLEERIATKLGHPERDPHGDPIPSVQGTINNADDVPLTGLEVGMRARVVRVPDDDPDLLRYLGTLGIVPGAWVRLDARAPYGNILTLNIGERSYPLAEAIAERVNISAASKQFDSNRR